MDLSLSHFARSLSGAENLEQLARPILLLLQRITGLESTYLTVIDEEKGVQSILFSENSGDLNIPEGLTIEWHDTLCKRALEEGTFYTSDVSERWADSQAALQLGLKTYLTVPVKKLDGGTYGTLCGASSKRAELDQETFDVLNLCSELIASQIARESAAKASQLRAAQAEEKLESLALLSSIGELCFQADDLRPALAHSARLLETRGHWDRAVPFVRSSSDYRFLEPGDGEWKALVSVVDQLIPATDASPGVVHPDPLLGRYTDMNGLKPVLEQLGLPVSARIALVSVETAAGRVAGLVLVDREKDDDTDNVRQVVISCSNYLSLLAERTEYLNQLERANQELSVYALHDPLTGLANRRYLVEELARMLATAQRSGGHVYVAFIDLDGFKQINDRHGHDVGDDFLQAMAARLRGVSRAGDLVSRYGGDEFVVLSAANGEDGPAGLEAYLERLRAASCGHFALSQVSVDYGGPSVGGVMSHPQESDPDSLLARADDAMYAIKKARRKTSRQR